MMNTKFEYLTGIIVKLIDQQKLMQIDLKAWSSNTKTLVDFLTEERDKEQLNQSIDKQIKKDGTENNQSVRLNDLSASGISPIIVYLRLYISRIIQYIRNNARNIRIKATKNQTYP